MTNEFEQDGAGLFDFLNQESPYKLDKYVIRDIESRMGDIDNRVNNCLIYIIKNESIIAIINDEKSKLSKQQSDMYESKKIHENNMLNIIDERMKSRREQISQSDTNERLKAEKIIENEYKKDMALYRKVTIDADRIYKDIFNKINEITNKLITKEGNYNTNINLAKGAIKILVNNKHDLKNLLFNQELQNFDIKSYKIKVEEIEDKLKKINEFKKDFKTLNDTINKLNNDTNFYNINDYLTKTNEDKPKVLPANGSKETKEKDDFLKNKIGTFVANNVTLVANNGTNKFEYSPPKPPSDTSPVDNKAINFDTYLQNINHKITEITKTVAFDKIANFGGNLDDLELIDQVETKIDNINKVINNIERYILGIYNTNASKMKIIKDLAFDKLGSNRCHINYDDEIRNIDEIIRPLEQYKTKFNAFLETSHPFQQQNQNPINKSTGSYLKYLKYKNKYLELKMSMENN